MTPIRNELAIRLEKSWAWAHKPKKPNMPTHVALQPEDGQTILNELHRLQEENHKLNSLVETLKQDRDRAYERVGKIGR